MFKSNMLLLFNPPGQVVKAGYGLSLIFPKPQLRLMIIQVFHVNIKMVIYMKDPLLHFWLCSQPVSTASDTFSERQIEMKYKKISCFYALFHLL
ncbi:hypothetical protein EG68_09046 [Paragonimus skrjabini miyazakii]|uniref:Uncharacterized protein n=1 Tax=Paragonimus skrjabini miyazakii TaxID=59628 RepID=A0A8S9YDP7_9TREM|nr:hypothetical protein EG68_09046 [Paragonimus skrjabini miyazakii]